MKYSKWYDSLTPQMKEYLKKQPVWHDRDLYKATGIGVGFGLVLGFLFGIEWAWKPVTTCARYITG